MTDPPPAVPLLLTPDEPGHDPIDLAGLDDIDWARLEHAHGSAADVPDLIRALADPSGEWSASLDELFADDLVHQGT